MQSMEWRERGDKEGKGQYGRMLGSKRTQKKHAGGGDK